MTEKKLSNLGTSDSSPEPVPDRPAASVVPEQELDLHDLDFAPSTGQGEVQVECVNDGFLDGVIDSTQFARAEFPRSWLVDSLLVEGQATVIGGPKKSLKTSIAIDLAISLAIGAKFLNHFLVRRPVRVLILSGESGEATIQETAKRICQFKGLKLEDCQEQLLWG